MRGHAVQRRLHRHVLQDVARAAVAAVERAYEFTPNHYTWEARSAAHALAKKIRKESTQPKG